MRPALLLVACLVTVAANAQEPDCSAAVARIGDPDPEARLSAHEEVTRCGEAAVPALAASLGSKNVDQAFFSIRFLGELGPKAKPALEKLRPFLRHKDWDTEAAAAMSRIDPAGRRAALPVFIRHLESKDHDTVVGVFDHVRTLALWQDVPPATFLKLVNGKNEDHRNLALGLLQEHAHPFADRVTHVAPLSTCGEKALAQDCFLEEGASCRYAGDFDGDGRLDVARLVLGGASKKRGIAFQLASGRCVLAGAGKAVGPSGDDLQWLKEWNLDFRPRGKGTSIRVVKGTEEALIFSAGGLKWEVPAPGQ